jgi:hypothetical protein
VDLIHEYPYPARLVWDVVTDLGFLKEVTSGLVAFRGLPSGKITLGQKIEVEVSLFGWLPYQAYRMELVEVDVRDHHFRSVESGAGVKSWTHRLRLEDTATGCRLIEKIEIDAGLITPAFRAWATFLYKRRHAPRLEILNRLNG